MLDIIWVILCIIIGAPFIISPDKIINRPGCKIKSPAVIRILGVLIIILGLIQLFV